MRNILFFIVVFTNYLLASNNYELKLYEKVLPLLFKQDTLLIYADKEAKEVLDNSEVFYFTNDCENATLIIGNNIPIKSAQCSEKPIFATSYRSFKNTQNSFGAFYWRKGRPQIKFKNEIIQKYNLYLPSSMQKYTR